jgi:ribosome-associated toxin RatA of RatAB toxin-antitoxin module
MTTINRSALMLYSTEEVFSLVNDVARYREFLPACIASEVLEESPAEMRARLAFSRMGMSQSLITLNRLTPFSTIEIKFVSGPFDFLDAHWKFQELNAHACKVIFTLNFQVQAKFLQFAATSALNQAASQTVDAFQRRAVQIYGQR